MKSQQILSGPPGWITEDRTGTSDVREQSEQRTLETQQWRISLQPELPDLLWRGPCFFEESQRETVSSWNIIMKGRAIKSWTRYGLYQELWRHYLTKENMTSGHLLNFMLELKCHPETCDEILRNIWISQPYVYDGNKISGMGGKRSAMSLRWAKLSSLSQASLYYRSCFSIWTPSISRRLTYNDGAGTNWVVCKI